MNDTFRTERFQQVMTGALSHLPVGAETEFEGLTFPITAQQTSGWISTEEVDSRQTRIECVRVDSERAGRTQAA